MNSVAAVAAEHAALIAALPDRGVAVINADDAFAPLWRDAVARRNAHGASIDLCDFGLRAAARVTAQQRIAAWGQVLKIASPSGTVTIDLQAHGDHNAMNALAAIATAMAAGVEVSGVAEGLAAFRPVSGRLQHKTGSDGATVIDDTYNANPDSVRAAIAVLAMAQVPRVLVLGDMGEVGDQGIAFHREIGAYARAAGIERLLAIGDLTVHAVAAFGDDGEHFDDIAAITTATRKNSHAGATVLVKGSRFMRMERVVAALTADTSQVGAH
jgi:UDP-N-acetylmuramoyl-tripeptide--D-alanyl-D-alanine ligase